MRALLLVLATSIALAGCGVKRPLIAPRDIPEYERKREEKLRKRVIEEEVMLHQRDVA